MSQPPQVHSYPHHQAILNEEMEEESHSQHVSDSQHSLMQGQNYVVAQLPVTPAETHSTVFPRSVSMPLPNVGMRNPLAEDSNLSPAAVNQHQLITSPTNSNSNEVRSSTVAKIEHIKNWR